MGNVLWHLSFWGVLFCLAASGISPVDRATWCMEVPWIFIGIAIVAWLRFKGTRLTMLLGSALVLHALILIYGGYYTYEQTPLGFWMKDAFGFIRNNYDRIGHFAQGFFPAILYREILYRNHVVNGKYWLETIIFATAMAFTAIFEIIEFTSAVTLGDASALYLGSQGDIWDAQWDMVFCGIGALISIIFFSSFHKRQMDKLIL